MEHFLEIILQELGLLHFEELCLVLQLRVVRNEGTGEPAEGQGRPEALEMQAKVDDVVVHDEQS